MLTPAPRAVATPVKNAVRGRWVARTTAKMGARVDNDPSISPLSAGWTRVSKNDRVSMGSRGLLTVAMVLLALIGTYLSLRYMRCSRLGGSPSSCEGSVF